VRSAAIALTVLPFWWERWQVCGWPRLALLLVVTGVACDSWS
jgi:hypothetical protein